MSDELPLDSAVEPGFEWKLRAAAIPLAIGLALAFHAWPTGHFLQRTFLSMMVHELGHAVTAWWSGFPAVPTLWKTMIPESRSAVVPVALLVLEGWICVRGWRAQRIGWTLVGLALAVVQLVGTTAHVGEAHQAITFGGDAGAMVLGTLLMLTFFVGAESKLRTNQLRWGFLVIGAAALIDTSATWISARTDTDVIPFGEIEGVGLSDPSKLQEVYGWTTHQIVQRYVVVAAACFIALVLAWLYFTYTERRKAEAGDAGDGADAGSAGGWR